MIEDNTLRVIQPAAGGSKPPSAPPQAAPATHDPYLNRIRAITGPIMAAGLDLAPFQTATRARVVAKRVALEHEMISRRNQIAANIGPILALPKGDSDGWE